MKNLVLHYVMLLLPFWVLVLLFDFISSYIFILCFFLWAFVYMPLLNGRRLYKKGMKEKIKWIPFLYLRPKWFIEVFFRR